jgi:hypothetical protein
MSDLPVRMAGPLLSMPGTRRRTGRSGCLIMRSGTPARRWRRRGVCRPAPYRLEESAMPDVSGPGGVSPAARPRLPATAGLDGLKDRTAAEAALEPESPAAGRVGWGFVSLYALAYMSTSLLFIAPLLVTLALKVDSLVGIGRAPGSLALVAGIGALVAMAGNPFFGKLSDRTASRLGMRRPWMVIGLAGGSWALSLSRWRRASSCWPGGVSPSCSSMRCSRRWWRCCRTRFRPFSVAWSPAHRRESL